MCSTVVPVSKFDSIFSQSVARVRAVPKISNMVLFPNVRFCDIPNTFHEMATVRKETANDTCLTNYSLCSVGTMAGSTFSEAEVFRSIPLRHTNQQQATVCAVHACYAFIRLIC